jgi:hypothetical protein
MPRPKGEATFTEVISTAYTQLVFTRKVGFAIAFYVRVLRKHQIAYAAANFCALWVTLSSVAFPLTVCPSFREQASNF